MRKRFVYDIETDGFVKDLTKIHCLVLWDLDTQELLSYRNDGNRDNLEKLVEAVRMLDAATFRAGHNIIKFDEPALAKLFPFFRANRNGAVFDTLTAARLVWPSIVDSDKGRIARGTLPGRLMGSHSLEAWGARLFCWKGDYSVKAKERILREWKEAWGDTPLPAEDLNKMVWATWSQEMQDYCDQDVIANTKLYAHIMQKEYSARAFSDEMDAAILCQKIEENGFPYDEAKGGALYATLVGERERLSGELKGFFGGWVEQAGAVRVPKTRSVTHGWWGEVVFTSMVTGEPLGPDDLSPTGLPTANAKARGFKREFIGYPFTPIKLVAFNPTSRFHIANRLKALYGWEPSEFTPSGEPKVDEDVLDGLTFPGVPLLMAYFLVSKRLGQLAEGKQAWLQLVTDGRIHGSYNTVGAVTRRATHSRPNISQVPKVQIAKDKSILYGVAGGWGYECREMFHAPKGWWQVGTDASGLELRCLAHFMARWDSGLYASILLTGDVHEANRIAAGLPNRDNAKTFIYAFLYGAGDEKIGSITGGGAAAGKRLKAQFLEGLPALRDLVIAVKTKAKNLRTLIALDGGTLFVRSDHSALNTLLQSAGALICKKWIVLMEQELIRRGYKHGWDGDFAFMAWVHDEVQIACKTNKLANEIGEVSRLVMKETERYFEFRCPLDADYKVGKSWAECH